MTFLDDDGIEWHCFCPNCQFPFEATDPFIRWGKCPACKKHAGTGVSCTINHRRQYRLAQIMHRDEEKPIFPGAFM